MQWMTLFSVMVGGAVGAGLRYGLAGLMAGWVIMGVPLPILVINALGSCLLGVMVEGFALKWTVAPHIHAALTIGMMGGLTTFSTFSMEAYLMIQKHQMAEAAAYIIGSAVVSIAAFAFGMHVIKFFN